MSLRQTHFQAALGKVLVLNAVAVIFLNVGVQLGVTAIQALILLFGLRVETPHSLLLLSDSTKKQETLSIK